MIYSQYARFSAVAVAVPLASQNPPHDMVLYFVANCRPRSHLSHFWARPECNGSHLYFKYFLISGKINFNLIYLKRGFSLNNRGAPLG